MSRDNILHKVRTALGRSAGQAVADVPPVRLRVPEVAMEDRIALMMARVEALAGKTARVPTMEAAREFVAAAIAGKTAVASNAPYLKECGIAGLPGVRSGVPRSGRTERTVRPAGYRHHERGLRAERYRDAGDVVRPAGGAPDVAAAAGAPRGSAAERILTGLDELFTLLPNPGGADQFHGADHGPEPHGGYRADSGPRGARAGDRSRWSIVG